jgi:DNA-binding NarL/FixJ family response regulator
LAVTIRVFLVDDHEVVRRGLRELLSMESGLEVVGDAGTATEGVAGILRTRPDVVLLDGRLPDGSGIEVCRTVRAALPDTRALVLTSYDDDETLFNAIAAGASGYLLKEVSGTDLVDAVRRVAAGQSLLDPSLTARVLARMRNGATVTDELAKLTDQERRIVVLVGEGMTNRQIAERLGLAEKTVKNHVSRLLAKLGLERRTQAAVLVAKLGTAV